MTSRSFLGAQVRTKSTTRASCPHHPGNDAIFVCVKPGCDGSFACMECFSTFHKDHDMEKLADYAAFKKNILQNKIKTGKENTLTLLLQYIKSIEQKALENKDRTRQDLEKIIQRYDDIKVELENICTKYKALRKKSGDVKDKVLTKHKECLDAVYTQYKAQLEECESDIEEGSDSDIVLADKKFPTPPNYPNPPETEDLRFNFSAVPMSHLEKWFGELLCVKDTGFTMTTAVSPGTNVSPSANIQQVVQFVLKRNTSHSCSFLFPLSSAELYVWFYRSRTILLVNRDGNVINTIILQPGLDKSHEIQSVCVSPTDGTLWSASWSASTVKQIHPNGEVLQSFAVDDAITVSITLKHSVLVGVTGAVKVFTTSGKHTRTLTEQDTGLNDIPFYIVQCQTTGRMAMTDYDSVSVLDERFGLLYTIHGKAITTADGKTKSTGYKSKEEFRPFRMCFDDDGDLLVSDTSNYSVILFSSSGQFLGTIVQETGEDKRPLTIKTAPDRTLWVAHDNDVFKQIKYK